MQVRHHLRNFSILYIYAMCWIHDPLAIQRVVCVIFCSCATDAIDGGCPRRERQHDSDVALASFEERAKLTFRQAVDLAQTSVAPRVRAVEDADIRTVVQDDVTRLRVNLLVACGQ